MSAFIMCLALFVSSSATAREAVFLDVRGGSVDLVPPGPIVADGSIVSLLVVVTDENGRLAEGADFEGSVATISYFDPDCDELAPGLYACEYGTPNWMPERGGELKLQATLRTGATVRETHRLEYVRGSAGEIEGRADPEILLLGRDGQSFVEFEVRDEFGNPVDGLDLAVHCNVGEVLDVSSIGQGIYETTFYPPESEEPQVALLSVWDTSNPDNASGFLSIPLHGSIDLPVKVRDEDVEITFRVGDKTFPRVISDRYGEANVLLTVPPGYPSAHVEFRQPDGSDSEREMDLEIPPYGQAVIGGIPDAVPADGKQRVQFQVFAVDAFGKPIKRDEDLVLDVTKGKIRDISFVGDGVFNVVYTPPTSDKGRAVEIAASLAGENESVADTAEIHLLSGGPSRVTLKSDPERITSSVMDVTLTAKLLDGEGYPSEGPFDVEFTTSDQPPEGIRQDSPGIFLADVQLDERFATWVQVVAGLEGSRNEVAHLVALPLSDALRVGEESYLTVLTLDHSGYPVRDVDVDARVLSGGGQVKRSITTDYFGVGVLPYQAGDEAGLATVEISARGQRYTIPIVQTSKGLDFVFEFPAAGGQIQQPILSMWKDLSAGLALGGPPRRDKLADLPPRPMIIATKASRDRDDDRDYDRDDDRDYDEWDEDERETEARAEAPRKPRKKAPKLDREDARMAQVHFGWAPGAYYYIGVPCEEDGNQCFTAPEDERDEEDFAEESYRGNVAASMSLIGEWFPFQDYAGFRIGYARIGHSNPDASWDSFCEDAPTCKALNFFNIEAQGRLPLLKEKGPLDLLLRFGYQYQDSVMLRADNRLDTPEVTTEGLYINGLTAGLGVRYTIIPRLRPHIDYTTSFANQAGMAGGATMPLPGLTNHHISAGIAVLPVAGLLVDVSYNLRIRTFNVGMADENDEPQEGQIYEQAHTIRFGIGYAF